MTPAITILKKKRVSYHVHQYTHAPETLSYGLEAAEKLGVDPARVFKTLVVMLDEKELAAGVIPVSEKLNMKLMAKAAGARKAAMARPADVERATGYVLGGVSPVGQKKRLPIYLDNSARNFDTIFVSAGRRGMDIELAPADLLALVGGSFQPLSQERDPFPAR